MVKNESLICYIEKLKSIDEISLNLDDLSRIFDQPIEKIKEVMTQMIKNLELEGSIKDNLILINNQQKEVVKTDSEWQLL